MTSRFGSGIISSMPQLPSFLVALAMLLVYPSTPERVVGRRVQFTVGSDGALRPVLPVELRAERESGDAPTTLLTCDVVARDHDVVADGVERTETETVLRCGPRRFVVKQIIFTESR